MQSQKKINSNLILATVLLGAILFYLFVLPSLQCKQEKDLKDLESFVHRTFNSIDAVYFIKSLQNIYQNHNGLESVFAKHQEATSLQNSISEAKKVFFELEHPQRTTKHFSDPMNGSAAKRINI